MGFGGGFFKVGFRWVYPKNYCLNPAQKGLYVYVDTEDTYVRYEALVDKDLQCYSLYAACSEVWPDLVGHRCVVNRCPDRHTTLQALNVQIQKCFTMSKWQLIGRLSYCIVDKSINTFVHRELTKLHYAVIQHRASNGKR